MQTAIERRDLAQFIEENKQEILEKWVSWRRQERKSGQLTREQLLDHDCSTRLRRRWRAAGA